jgi:hypothetical protein
MLGKLPVSLFPFVKGTDIVLIILLIKTLNFAGVTLLQSLCETGTVVLLDLARARAVLLKDIWVQQ